MKLIRSRPLLTSCPTTAGREVSREAEQMKIPAGKGLLISGAMAAALITTGTSTAHANPVNDSAKPKGGQYCATVLAPTRAGENESHVTFENCYASEKERASAPALRDTTLLMTWYKDRDYFGGSTQWRGSAGGCDSAGYGKAVVDWDWATTISSFKVWSGCYHTTAYTNENFGGASRTYSGNVPYVGDFMNDIIHSMWVKS
jgi:hypothetical protein